MKNKLRRLVFALPVLMICAAVLPACHSGDTEYVRAGFSVAAVDRIWVMPAVDGRRRIDPKSDFPASAKVVQDAIVAALRAKGHEVTAVTDAPPTLTADRVAFADPGVIRSLGPPEARWVLVPVVDDLTEAEVTAYLFDKQAGQEVWEGSQFHDRGLETVADQVIGDALDKKP